MKVKLQVYCQISTIFSVSDPELKWECLLKRVHPLGKWILLTSFNIGYEPGDVFDWCPIKPDKGLYFVRGNREGLIYHAIATTIRD